MPFLNWAALPTITSAGRTIRLVDADKATIIRLECEGPTSLDPHVHPDIEQVSVVIDGEMEFGLGEEWRTVHAGDVVQVPAGTLHGMRVKEGNRAIAVEFFTPRREDLRGQARPAG